jgi:hypothetical protein
VAVAHQLFGHGAVAVEALRLEVRPVVSAFLGTLVPVEAKPPHPLQDALHHVPRRTFDVGVFDAQDEHAAHAARVQPVEQGRAGTADVEVSGGRRGKADAWNG